MIILVIIIAIPIIIINPNEKGRNAIIDQANGYLRVAESAEDLDKLFYCLACFNGSLKKYRRFENKVKRHPEKYNSLTFDGDQERIDIHFQWLIRNTIERMEKTTAANINKYHNSDEYMESCYNQFIADTDRWLKYFDQKTINILGMAKQNLARKAGISVFSNDPIAPSQSSTNDQYVFDNMDGKAFENYCAELLKANGYENVQTTQTTGDQGVDIIATKGEIKYAIQCKCYSSDLGNTPVQEVTAGKMVYGCHVGAVITNRYFTEGAKRAAQATGTLLWDRDRLIAMLHCKG